MHFPDVQFIGVIFKRIMSLQSFASAYQESIEEKREFSYHLLRGEDSDDDPVPLSRRMRFGYAQRALSPMTVKEHWRFDKIKSGALPNTETAITSAEKANFITA